MLDEVHENKINIRGVSCIQGVYMFEKIFEQVYKPGREKSIDPPSISNFNGLDFVSYLWLP